MEKIYSKDIEAWNNAGQSEKLHMPHRNEFIPEKLDLVPREEVAKIYFFFLNSLLDNYNDSFPY
jgi:secreted Zn-dependent insulinase-like peptidase